MLDEILKVVSGIGSVAKTAGEVVDTVKKVKEMFQGGAAPAPLGQGPTFAPGSGTHAPAMYPFQPQTVDPFGGGARFLDQLSAMAAQQSGAWVPAQTQGVSGVELTGLWVPPMNPIEQTYIRQFGVYLNLVTGMGLTMGGMPVLLSEGIFDPVHMIVHVVGRFVTGAPLEARAQLFPNWTLQGLMAQLGPFGMPMNQPLILAKVA